MDDFVPVGNQIHTDTTHEFSTQRRYRLQSSCIALRHSNNMSNSESVVRSCALTSRHQDLAATVFDRMPPQNLPPSSMSSSKADHRRQQWERSRIMNHLYQLKKMDQQLYQRRELLLLSPQPHHQTSYRVNYTSLRSPAAAAAPYLPENRIRSHNHARSMRHALSLLMTTLLCSIGVIWQLYAITDNFFRYSIVSEVYMEKHDEITPPSLSICFPFIELLDWDQMRDVNSIPKADFYLMSEADRNKVRQKIQSNLTISQIFDYTPRLSDMMKYSQVRVNDFFEISEDADKLDSVRFLKDDLMCYRLTSSSLVDEDFRLSSLLLTYGSDPGILLSVTLDHRWFSNISKVMTFLHPSDVYPRGDGDFPFTFIANNGSPVFGFRGASSYIGLTYTKITLNLLKPPFRTMCYDYQAHGYESAYHCVHSCITSKLLSLLNVTSFTSTFTDGRPEKMLDKYSIYQNKSMEVMFKSLYSSCRKSCPGKNCLKHIFSPALVSLRNSSDVTFVLYSMNGPEYKLIFKPATNLVDLYVQILSVCGAWLGISCVDIIFHSFAVCMGCKHILRKHMIRCQQYLK